VAARSCAKAAATARELADPDRDRAAQARNGLRPRRDDDTPRAEAHVSDGTHPARLHRLRRADRLHRPRLSENCPYCNGAVVRGPEESSYATMGLIPFGLPMTGPWPGPGLDRAPPRRAGRPVAAASEGRMAGLYAPFWTFDSDEAITYWARYNVRSGKNTRVRTVKGSMRTRFDDLLVPASPHVTALIRDGILHDFRPGDLRAFRARLPRRASRRSASPDRGRGAARQRG
jgi:hypothetical protein